MPKVSTRMSQANALPTQVLNVSMRSRKFFMCDQAAAIAPRGLFPLLENWAARTRAALFVIFCCARLRS
jgi:hypothetical protein